MSTRARDFIDKYNCFFITTTFNDWMPLFINDNYYKIVIDSIRYCLDKYNAQLIAYVLMPNHLHMVLFYNDKVDVSGFMRDLKKYTSVKIRDMLFADERKEEIKKILYVKHGQNYKVWKTRFDAVIIKHGKVLVTKMKYIHENPLRKGLVEREEDWKYSSAGYYKTEKQGLLPITHAWKIM